MKRVELLVLVLSSVTLISGCGGKVPVISPAVDKADNKKEYEIYSQVIEKVASEKQASFIIIDAQASISHKINDGLAGTIAKIRQAMPGLGDDVIRDFEIKNSSPYTFDDLFKLNLKYSLINKNELDEIVGSDPTWGAFYRKFPGSGRKLTLSRAGFSKGLDTAIIYTEIISGPKNGYGEFYYLKKSKDHWEITKQFELWVS